MIVPLTSPYFHVVSQAHVELDPTAFLSQIKEIGVTFREEIFYPALIEDPDGFVWIYLVQGNLAGYIAGTQDVPSFYKLLKRRAPLLLFRLLAKAILKMPSLLVKYAASGVRMERMPQKELIPAEIISFGVLPAYRTPEFELQHGRHVAKALFEKAVESFRQAGIREYKVMTIQQNKAANRFYERQGCRLAGTSQPFGVPCNVFVGELK